MVAVTIVKSFTLTHDETTDPSLSLKGTDQFIPVGVHDFPDEVANHWYVQAHSDNPPLARPKPGTPQYAEQQAKAARRRALVEAAIEMEGEQAKAKVIQDAHLTGRIAEAEEQVHEETMEQEAAAEEESAKNEAVRTGTRIPAPRRRPVLPERNAPQNAQPDRSNETPSERTPQQQPAERGNVQPPTPVLPERNAPPPVNPTTPGGIAAQQSQPPAPVLPPRNPAPAT